MKEAQFIFRQCQKGADIPMDATFYERVVDMRHIFDENRYYFGILFEPSTSGRFSKTACMTETADETHS